LHEKQKETALVRTPDRQDYESFQQSWLAGSTTHEDVYGAVSNLFKKETLERGLISELKRRKGFHKKRGWILSGNQRLTFFSLHPPGAPWA
jgi:hypothetical protein